MRYFKHKFGNSVEYYKIEDNINLAIPTTDYMYRNYNTGKWAQPITVRDFSDPLHIEITEDELMLECL